MVMSTTTNYTKYTIFSFRSCDPISTVFSAGKKLQPALEGIERFPDAAWTGCENALYCSKDILQRLPQIAASMPTMTERGHRQKYLVVLENVQEVHDMAIELQKQIAAKRSKNAMGQTLVVACFFTGYADTANGASTTDAKVNGTHDSDALEKADIIVLCRKYTVGWDEWRVVSIFILRRVTSPEFLMQLLGVQPVCNLDQARGNRSSWTT